MNANEIEMSVLLGSHDKVKAYLQAEVIDRVGGEYSGCGQVWVRVETKAEALAWANAAQATLDPAKFKVCKVKVNYVGYHAEREYIFEIKAR